MTRARDFFSGLTRAGKDYDEILKTVNAAFGDKTLQKTAIYAIIKKIKAGETTSDQSHLNGKKTVPNIAFIISLLSLPPLNRISA
jgi:hypothetical protein